MMQCIRGQSETHTPIHPEPAVFADHATYLNKHECLEVGPAPWRLLPALLGLPPLGQHLPAHAAVPVGVAARNMCCHSCMPQLEARFQIARTFIHTCTHLSSIGTEALTSKGRSKKARARAQALSITCGLVGLWFERVGPVHAADNPMGAREQGGWE